MEKKFIKIESRFWEFALTMTFAGFLNDVILFVQVVEDGYQFFERRKVSIVPVNRNIRRQNVTNVVFEVS